MLATGHWQIRKAIVDTLSRSREVLAVRAGGTAPDSVLEAFHTTVPLIDSGVRMLSLYDLATSADTRRLISSLPGRNYHFCHGPLELKILDRRGVILAGPARGGEQTIMMVTRPDVVQAALRYVAAVRASAIPATAAFQGSRIELTGRQELVAALLAEDLTDAVIAARMDVSVRTVQSEIRALYAALGVRSRFAAGVALAAEWDARLSPPSIPPAS